MKYIMLTALAGCLLVLAGCEEERQKIYQQQLDVIKSNLPAGCNVKDVGEYANINHVLIIACEGKASINFNYEERHGKKHLGNFVAQVL